MTLTIIFIKDIVGYDLGHAYSRSVVAKMAHSAGCTSYNCHVSHGLVDFSFTLILHNLHASVVLELSRSNLVHHNSVPPSRIMILF
jgi:hypothetical protein